ncbi:MAG: hypothetical protein EOO43_01495 [Flavobacterium sp.]|nr:MAG: hypothetical protein EOO43_01495 [Flavobacterium sp.]
MEVLDFENPDWRESDQDKFTLRIPCHNELPNNSKKVEMIAGINRHVAEAAEYSERFFDIENKLTSILHYPDKFQDYPKLIKELKRVKRLTTLLKRNNLCVGQDSIEDLIIYIQQVRDGIVTPKETEDFPHNFNREQLAKENESRIFMGTFLAENEDETAY